MVDKYQTELISSSPSVDYLYYYEDLDGDGNSEKISYYRKYNDRLGIMIFTGNRVIDQWNFHGVWAKTAFPFVADFDHDGIKEIFVFTLRSDSVYLYCLDAFNKKIETDNKAICKVYRVGGAYDFMIYPCAVYDADGDGYDDFFFSIRTGFSTVPRNMFRYDLVKDQLLISPESCSPVIYPVMFDMDGDNKPEFISSITYATDNCEPGREYHDLYNWLMVFTPEMNFKFPPKRFDVYPAITWFSPFRAGNENYYLALHMYRGTENFPSFIALYNRTGKTVRKKKLRMDEDWVNSALFSKEKDYKDVFILRGDSIMQIDSMLNIHFVTRFKNIAKTNRVQKIDIDCDGVDEFTFAGHNKGEIIIFRNDFSNPVLLKLGGNTTTYQLSVVKKNGDLPKIFVNTNENSYLFSYTTSLLYRYRYVLFVPILLLILIFHFTVLKIRKYRQLKIDNTQKLISELQVKSVQNQLDPHFTFNIFQSFANLIDEKDTDRADFILRKYARLLKASVMRSENIQITLQEEMDFIADYLELERFRYPGRFTFRIKLQNSIDKQMYIPKMLMHIFVENAVKHGLRHLDSGGELIIEGIKEDETVFISIRDNGIGREKAKKYGNFSTGKGLAIVDQILESYYRLYRMKITYVIEDLYENNKSSGTQVKIRIPLK